VPKRVDHHERRRQIADALVRVDAARGLHATGMREVAAEAGVSVRLVQYYFGTKEELMLAAMKHLAAGFSERGIARIKRMKEAAGPVRPRDVVAAILAEGLPADDGRRTFNVVYTAYLALSLTDPALVIAPLVGNSDAVINVVAAQLRAAQAAGDSPAHLDPDQEALSLLAMSAGLATSVLAGQSSVGKAQAAIDYQLNRLFPGSGQGLRRPARTTSAVIAVLVTGCLFRRGRRIGVSLRLAWVNGQPGAVTYDTEGRVISVFALDIADGAVQAIRSVINPDKLGHIGPVSDLGRLPGKNPPALPL